MNLINRSTPMLRVKKLTLWPILPYTLLLTLTLFLFFPGVSEVSVLHPSSSYNLLHYFHGDPRFHSNVPRGWVRNLSHFLFHDLHRSMKYTKTLAWIILHFKVVLSKFRSRPYLCLNCFSRDTKSFPETLSSPIFLKDFSKKWSW